MKNKENQNKKTENKKSNPVADFFWKNKKQRGRNFMFLLTVFLVVVSLAIGFVSSKLDMLQADKTNDNNPEDGVTSINKPQKVYEDENNLTMIDPVTGAVSYNDYINTWANNGAPLRSSKNVLNVLLIGLDSTDALQNGGRSDTIILASLNKKTKKIYLTSFYRDSWTYMNIKGNTEYAKINASYMFGGDDALIDALEKDFKIDIDYYAAVDFTSFTDLINTLGGITVEVEQYEAEYINRTTVHTIDYGENVTLNGYEALVYARIRHSDADSDVSRTKRQRKVISAFVQRTKGASLSQLNNMLNTLFKYVKTDLSKTQLLSYAAQALANGWASYDIEQVPLNDEKFFATGYVGDQSVVFMDFPAAAHAVQTAIYGNSNIKQSEDKQNPYNFLSYGSDGQYIMY